MLLIQIKIFIFIRKNGKQLKNTWCQIVFLVFFQFAADKLAQIFNGFCVIFHSSGMISGIVQKHVIELGNDFLVKKFLI